jgi:hypothetical protein
MRSQYARRESGRWPYGPVAYVPVKRPIGMLIRIPSGSNATIRHSKPNRTNFAGVQHGRLPGRCMSYGAPGSFTHPNRAELPPATETARSPVAAAQANGMRASSASSVIGRNDVPSAPAAALS